MATSSEAVISKPPSDISENLSFFWLDKDDQDYFRFQNTYSKKLDIPERSWSYAKDKVNLIKDLKLVKLPQKVILVSSGAMAAEIIQDIHNLEQLQSIHIFCRNIPKYQSLKESYHKVFGVQSDTNLLYEQLQENLEILQSEEAAKIAATPPKHSRTALKDDDKGVDFFAQPGTHWCPWNSNNCNHKLPVSGQGTIQIMLQKSIPFELQLSNREDHNDPNAYKIFLSVDENEAKIGTNSNVLDSSKLTRHVLQPGDGQWHTYWLSLFKDTQNIKYGIGEVRAAFTIFDVFLNKDDMNAIRQTCYLHVKMNKNERMLLDLGNIRENVRFFIGKEPIVYDPAIFVVPQDQYSLEVQSAIPPSKLEKPCRDLYDNIIKFRLNTDDFPDFVQAIERSIENPEGWCYKKLVEKANRFGRPNPKATYLRITYGQRVGNSPGHPYVIEVWPPGHFSPIHNHSNAYGIIRILYGRLLVKMYPELTTNVVQCVPIEQILEEGDVTWMLPSLNQTHQVRNPNLYGKSAISIQCYQYGQDDNLHYEYFDYISNDGLTIAHFDPKSDMDYLAFKELMRKEWSSAK